MTAFEALHGVAEGLLDLALPMEPGGACCLRMLSTNVTPPHPAP